MQVYTFGAPRVGNHAFARDCRDKLPELWNVINDQACCARDRAVPCALAAFVYISQNISQTLRALQCAAVPLITSNCIPQGMSWQVVLYFAMGTTKHLHIMCLAGHGATSGEVRFHVQAPRPACHHQLRWRHDCAQPQQPTHPFSL